MCCFSLFSRLKPCADCGASYVTDNSQYITVMGDLSLHFHDAQQVASACSLWADADHDADVLYAEGGGAVALDCAESVQAVIGDGLNPNLQPAACRQKPPAQFQHFGGGPPDRTGAHPRLPAIPDIIAVTDRTVPRNASADDLDRLRRAIEAEIRNWHRGNSEIIMKVINNSGQSTTHPCLRRRC